jgi:hypothetical protein
LEFGFVPARAGAVLQGVRLLVVPGAVDATDVAGLKYISSLDVNAVPCGIVDNVVKVREIAILRFIPPSTPRFHSSMLCCLQLCGSRDQYYYHKGTLMLPVLSKRDVPVVKFMFQFVIVYSAGLHCP